MRESIVPYHFKIRRFQIQIGAQRTFKLCVGIYLCTYTYKYTMELVDHIRQEWKEENGTVRIRRVFIVREL